MFSDLTLIRTDLLCACVIAITCRHNSIQTHICAAVVATLCYAAEYVVGWQLRIQHDDNQAVKVLGKVYTNMMEPFHLAGTTLFAV